MKTLLRILLLLVIATIAGLYSCWGDDPPPSYTVGGTVSGLGESAYLVLVNGGDAITITKDSSFTFPTAATDGGAYCVTVQTDPVGQSTAVENGSGTVSGGNVTNITVTCSNELFNVGGTVSGLAESGSIVLMN